MRDLWLLLLDQCQTISGRDKRVRLTKVVCFFGLVLLPVWAQALTLSIEVGSAKVGDSKIENLSIQADSLEDWHNWRLKVQAPRVQHQSYQGREVLYQGRLRWQEGDVWFGPSSLKAIWAQTPFTLDIAGFKLAQVLGTELALPEGLSLNLSAGREKSLLSANINGQQGLNSHLHARLSLALLTRWLQSADIHLPDNLEGQLTPDIRLSRRGKAWRIHGALTLEQLNWQSADAMQALEKVNATLRLDFNSADMQRWQGELALEVSAGEGLITPIYISANQQPLRLQSEVLYERGRLKLSDWRFDDGVVNGRGSLVFDTKRNQLEVVDVAHLSGDAQAIYQRYAQPFLQDGIFNDAELMGTIFLSAKWAQNTLQAVDAVINRVSITDKQQRYALINLDGQIGNTDSGQRSYLALEQARWFDLPIGGFALDFAWREQGVYLHTPSFIPILNGGIEISQLAPDGDKGYRLQAAIKPIDLAQFSQALDWPVFSGVISGEFPDVRLRKDGLRLSRPVNIAVFDGQIQIDTLYLKGLFGDIPTVGFNVLLQDIDLGALTQAFDMAEVKGRIEGEAFDVVLVNWQPTQFETRIMTDLDNPGKRRISHEAVQYLSAAGGGSAVVGQFVRLLNEFPYEYLGVMAVLQGNTLTLEGLEAHEESGGYYLLKGRGLPHLDIIAYETVVDWAELLARLKTAGNTEGAVVE